MSNRPSLALDIGTRKVVGLLTTPTAKGLKITYAEKLEHSTRAMYDGQIHDVEEVARVVGRVVEKLSKRAGQPLTEAAVAAAGRALRTFKGTAFRELAGLTELTHDEVFALELEAVQAAQAAMAAALKDGENAHDYHYVGHSVMGARLDGLTIGNLVGQRGLLAEQDVIATFLPRAVVDSLQSVLNRCGLEMTALTLEPIAALTVAVPQSMRHLNLVLVDIGAGTSDIAITYKGSVLAYDMVPIAGDEITEALSEAYLMDFKVGESIKRQIAVTDEVTFTDILGQKQTVASSEMMKSLAPAVGRLAGQIADRILKLNNGVPQAVMLVGGGSLTPGLPAAVAAAVGLPEGRVAVRGRDAIAGVDGAKSLLAGPDSITPIGIAVASRERSTLGFHLVHVNGHSVRLFHPTQLTVADAVLAAGISIREMQGRVGRGLTITVNDELQIVRGTVGKPARILVNDEPATLETPIGHRNSIMVTPGTVGDAGKATVADVIPDGARPIQVRVNGVGRLIQPLVTVNRTPAPLDRPLADNDAVRFETVRTVEDVLLSLGYEGLDEIDVIRFTVEGEQVAVKRPRYQFKLNGQLCLSSAFVTDGDELELIAQPTVTLREAAAGAIAEVAACRIMLNGRQVDLAGPDPAIVKNGRPATLEELVGENDKVEILRSAEAPIFAHLLVRAGIGTTPPPGRTHLVMLLNGQVAEFTSSLKDGDRAEVRWE
ncbi:MAG: cell division FtsA domain-containing protein [Mycobacterium leprae]